MSPKNGLRKTGIYRLMMMSQENTQKIIQMNEGINLPKNKTAGVLPTEIFEKIFEIAEAMEAREAEEERIYMTEKYCECDSCGCDMTRQEFLHQEQNAKDEWGFPYDDYVSPDWKYCGIVCREQLAGEAGWCRECGEMCHLNFDGQYFQENSTDEERREKMGYHEEEFVCVDCVENWESDDEE